MFGCLRWGSSDAFGSAFLGLHAWELCFSLLFPLWESCYSLAFCQGMRPEGAVHLLRCSLCFSVYLLPPPFYLSSPLFFLSSFLFQLSHLLLFFFSLLCPFPLFFSFLPITLLFFSSFSPYHTPLCLFPLSCLLLILSFSFVPFLFFFFFEGIACTECLSRCNRGHH